MRSFVPFTLRTRQDLYEVELIGTQTQFEKPLNPFRSKLVDLILVRPIITKELIGKARGKLFKERNVVRGYANTN